MAGEFSLMVWLAMSAMLISAMSAKLRLAMSTMSTMLMSAKSAKWWWAAPMFLFEKFLVLWLVPAAWSAARRFFFAFGAPHLRADQ